MNTLITIILGVIGVAAIVADIVSADRALYHRMQKGGRP